MEDTISEWRIEQQVSIIDVAEELKGVRVRSGLAEDCSSLEDNLIGTEVAVQGTGVSLWTTFADRF